MFGKVDCALHLTALVYWRQGSKAVESNKRIYMMWPGSCAQCLFSSVE